MEHYLGRNLIIYADTGGYGHKVLAAAKSCELSMSSAIQSVSDPSDGAWEHIKPGRKSWSLNTSHLLLNNQPVGHVIEVRAQARGIGIPVTSPSVIIDGTEVVLDDTSGNRESLAVYTYNYSNPLLSVVTFFDTSIAQEREDFCTYLDTIIDEYQVAIVTTSRKFTIDDDMREAMAYIFDVDGSMFPSGTLDSSAFACIGPPRYGGATVSWTRTQGQHIDASMKFGPEWQEMVDNTPLTNMLTSVGQRFYLSMEMRGYGYDRIGGAAICKAAKVSGSVGNVVQGAFTFEGDGPLSAL